MKRRSVKAKKDPLGKWKSAWFLTINTNSSDRRLIEPLRAVFKEVVCNIAFFMEFRPGGGLIGCREKSNVEIGKKYHRIHLHSFLEVEAYGLAFLEYSVMKWYIDKQLGAMFPGFKGVYFHARLVRNYDVSQRALAYLDKDPVFG